MKKFNFAVAAAVVAFASLQAPAAFAMKVHDYVQVVGFICPSCR